MSCAVLCIMVSLTTPPTVFDSTRTTLLPWPSWLEYFSGALLPPKAWPSSWLISIPTQSSYHMSVLHIGCVYALNSSKNLLIAACSPVSLTECKPSEAVKLSLILPNWHEALTKILIRSLQTVHRLLRKFFLFNFSLKVSQGISYQTGICAPPYTSNAPQAPSWTRLDTWLIIFFISNSFRQSSACSPPVKISIPKSLMRLNVFQYGSCPGASISAYILTTSEMKWC